MNECKEGKAQRRQNMVIIWSLAENLFKREADL